MKHNHMRLNRGLMASLVVIALVLGYQLLFAATTISTNFTTGGSLTVQNGGIFSSTSAGTSNVVSTFALSDDSDADTVGAFEVNATSASTGDSDLLAGLYVKNLTSPSAVSEYAIYQAGTSWDIGLITQDAVVHTVPADANVMIMAKTGAGEVRTATSEAVFAVDVEGPRAQAILIDATVNDDNVANHADIFRIRPTYSSGHNDSGDTMYGINIINVATDSSGSVDTALRINGDNWSQAINIVSLDSVGSEDIGAGLNIEHSGTLVGNADLVRFSSTGNNSSTSNLLSLEQRSGSPVAGSYALYIDASAGSMEGIKVDNGNVVIDENLTVSGGLILPAGTALPGTCTQGQLYHDTNDNACANANDGDGALCICKTTNAWALVSNF